MNRRNFMSHLGMGGAASAATSMNFKLPLLGHPTPPPGPRLGLPKIGEMPDVRWQKSSGSEFFTQAVCEGIPLVYRGRNGLLTASWSLEGSKEVSPLLGLREGVTQFGGCVGKLQHHLRRLAQGAGEDVLEAELTLRNESGKAQMITLDFTSSARPFPTDEQAYAHYPLTATGLEDPAGPDAPGPWATNNVIAGQIRECDQPLINLAESGGAPVAHYLEARESDPSVLISLAPLLIPLVDLSNPKVDWRVALFCSPLRAWRIDSSSCRTRLKLAPGAEAAEKCYLLIHRGDAEIAWRAFHTLAHHYDVPRIAWPDDVVVHYTEFLAPSKDGGKRGPGFWEDVHEFSRFHVGLSVTEGYYPFFGDYIDPGRKSWTVMKRDPWGPVEMSMDELRRRMKAVRNAGAKVSVYLHQNCIDSASPAFSRLQDAVLVDKDGKHVIHPFVGPENVGTFYAMSVASPLWRTYLLQQVEWIMELLAPDAIEIDESFWGLGYDYRSGQPEALSQFMIPFQQKLHRLVRSFGGDKALFTSDCVWSSFVLWADGDVSDHENIFHEEYRKPPVRYLAALDDRRWLPLLWRPVEWWNYQMDLARKTGAGVAVSNGQIEYAVLTGQPPATRAMMLAGIEELKRRQSQR